MRFLIYILLSLLFLTACEDKNEELIDLNDIIPTEEDSNITETPNLGDSTMAIKRFYAKNGIHVKNLLFINEGKFPDRFGPVNVVKYQIGLENDTIKYFRWLYEDSVKVMNSFYNWIDCFGEDCNSLYIGEERNMQKNATLIFVSDSTIILIEGSKINFKNWYSFHDSLGYDKDWNYTIEQNFRSKARWYHYLDEVKVKCESKR